MKQKKYDIAVLGLGVMGQSLARNIASKGFGVLGWDRDKKKSIAFIEKYKNPHLGYCGDFKCLSLELKNPRKYLIMVPAGEAVEQVLKKLSPFLKRGDIVIDGGNSLFSDTARRTNDFKKKGIEFVGMGVSGGEEGALRGPSLMPGGSAKSWKELSPLLKKMAAKDFEGNPCVTHIGTDGAGHYVKMVHNGIEYAIMQMMAEAYDLLKNLYALKPNHIADVFEKFYKGKLKSFLFQIAIPVLTHQDKPGRGFLIDKILDKAEQKGTGRWTVMDGLERGVFLNTVAAAIQTRGASVRKADRVKFHKVFKSKIHKLDTPLDQFSSLLEDALYAGMICAYAEGMDLLKVAAKEEAWKINLAEITRVWQGGCIIRADLLKTLHQAFMQKGNVHLFEIPSIQKLLKENMTGLKCMVSIASASGISLPGLSSALNSFETMTRDPLPANFIQGLRDYFGAHTYERIDRKGNFHTNWADSNL